MRNLLIRKAWLVGLFVGVFIGSSALVAAAGAGRSESRSGLASHSAPAAAPASPAATMTGVIGSIERQALETPEVKNEEQNEPAENEPAENEPAENEPAENENEVAAPPAPPSSVPTSSRTFSLVGGTVGVTCRGSVISLDSVTPNAGFTVESAQNEEGRVEVRFRSDNHESRLEVTCQNGQVVVQELREEES
jgi:hypothetical protein